MTSNVSNHKRSYYMLDFDTRFLPWSARRYSLDGIEKVYDIGNCEIKPLVINGEKYAELEWVQGKKKYSVALLVLIAFCGLKLPCHLYDEVIPLYKDGNKENLTGVEKQTIISHLEKESVIPIKGWNFRWHSNYSDVV